MTQACGFARNTPISPSHLLIATLVLLATSLCASNAEFLLQAEKVSALRSYSSDIILESMENYSLVSSDQVKDAIRYGMISHLSREDYYLLRSLPQNTGLHREFDRLFINRKEQITPASPLYDEVKQAENYQEFLIRNIEATPIAGGYLGLHLCLLGSLEPIPVLIDALRKTEYQFDPMFTAMAWVPLGSSLDRLSFINLYDSLNPSPTIEAIMVATAQSKQDDAPPAPLGLTQALEAWWQQNQAHVSFGDNVRPGALPVVFVNHMLFGDAPVDYEPAPEAGGCFILMTGGRKSLPEICFWDYDKESFIRNILPLVYEGGAGPVKTLDTWPARRGSIVEMHWDQASGLLWVIQGEQTFAFLPPGRPHPGEYRVVPPLTRQTIPKAMSQEATYPGGHLWLKDGVILQQDAGQEAAVFYASGNIQGFYLDPALRGVLIKEGHNYWWKSFKPQAR